jgi:hypothetical protein
MANFKAAAEDENPEAITTSLLWLRVINSK